MIVSNDTIIICSGSQAHGCLNSFAPSHLREGWEGVIDSKINDHIPDNQYI